MMSKHKQNDDPLEMKIPDVELRRNIPGTKLRYTDSVLLKK